MSNGRPVATLSNVGKQYVKFDDVPTLLTGLMRIGSRSRRKPKWAVRHVDLEVFPGEAVGVIGRNGSGKSTTLAMLSGVTAPTEGTVTVRGRLAPLLRLGVGFHEELTGRENVYINGTVLGMSRAEIDSKFDEIVAFSEIPEYIDTPVKFYSSGMQVRLGFATAVATRPDILVVDEVLSVGDLGFQMRSHERMMDIRNDGTTLLVVSHNMTAVRRVCDKVIVLHDGAVKFLGPTEDAISLYHDLIGQSRATDGEGGGYVSSFQATVHDSEGRPTSHFASGDLAAIRLRANVAHAVENTVFGVAITSESGQLIYGDNSRPLGPRAYEAGGIASCDVTLRVPMTSGTYYVGATLKDADTRKVYAAQQQALYVSGRPFVVGVTDLHADFDLDPATAGVTEAE